MHDQFTKYDLTWLFICKSFTPGQKSHPQFADANHGEQYYLHRQWAQLKIRKILHLKVYIWPFIRALQSTRGKWKIDTCAPDMKNDSVINRYEISNWTESGAETRIVQFGSPSFDFFLNAYDEVSDIARKKLSIVQQHNIRITIWYVFELNKFLSETSSISNVNGMLNFFTFILLWKAYTILIKNDCDVSLESNLIAMI